MEYIKNENTTDAKLWIFGDSFTAVAYESASWPILLHKNFIGTDAFVTSQGSRDIQTIIDIFLKNLHKIRKNDFVILMLPTTFRFRLPLEKLNHDIQYGNMNEHYYKTMFIGNTMYESIKKFEKVKDDSFENSEKYNSMKLEEPLCHLDPDIFKLENNITTKPKLDVGSIIGMINGSKASLRNYNEILNSFLLHFGFGIKLYSWTNELDCSIVDTKDIITKKCGIWHTNADDWWESDGVSGMSGDSHWSKKMDKLFAEMVIKENPNYFNQNI